MSREDVLDLLVVSGAVAGLAILSAGLGLW